MSRTPLNMRRELSIVLITISCSVILLPGLIFVVGSRIFGAYGSTGGIVSMYQATLKDFLELRLATWIIVLGPAICVALLRLTFRLTQSVETPDPAPQRTRREPTLNS